MQSNLSKTGNTRTRRVLTGNGACERDTLSQLTTELTALRTRLARVHQRLEYENQQATRIETRLTEIETEKTALVKAVALIDKTIEVVSANGVGRIETTVTNGLRLVFADPTLALKVVKNEGKRGNSYELIGKQGDVEGPFLETFGGGIANVASFLLRVLMLKRFKLAKLLVLDESFNNVSVNNLPRVSKLLKVMVDEGGYTIIAVTHQPILALAADNIYRATPNPDGPPTLEKITHGEVQADIAASTYIEEESKLHPSPRRHHVPVVEDGKMVGLRLVEEEPEEIEGVAGVSLVEEELPA